MRPPAVCVRAWLGLFYLRDRVIRDFFWRDQDFGVMRDRMKIWGVLRDLGYILLFFAWWQILAIFVMRDGEKNFAWWGVPLGKPHRFLTIAYFGKLFKISSHQCDIQFLFTLLEYFSMLCCFFSDIKRRQMCKFW